MYFKVEYEMYDVLLKYKSKINKVTFTIFSILHCHLIIHPTSYTTSY